MKPVNFKKDYPELFQFFAGYFPDADFDGITDEDVVAIYVADCIKSENSKIELEKTKKELINLIDNIEKYWQEVGKEANRYFHSSIDALQWLNMINQRLNRKAV